MEQLDQALSKLEADLYALLATSSDPKVRAILADINHLRGAKEILRRQAVPSATPAFVVDPNPKGVAGSNGHSQVTVWTQGDAAVDILRKAGQPLHINEILSRLPQYGITGAKKINLNTLLAKDRRKRFVNRGNATFALNPDTREAEDQPRPQNGLPPGFSLMESVKALLPELVGEFGQPQVYKMLTERHPHAADRIQRASVSTTLSKLKERGLIEETYEGYGSEPKRYKVI